MPIEDTDDAELRQRVKELCDVVASQEAELAALRQRITSRPARHDAEQSSSSRRQLLGMIGGAAAGAAIGGLTSGRTADAANGDPIRIAVTTSASAGPTNPTIIEYSQTSGSGDYVVITDAPLANTTNVNAVLHVQNTVGPNDAAIAVSSARGAIGIYVDMDCSQVALPNPIGVASYLYGQTPQLIESVAIIGGNENIGLPGAPDPALRPVGVWGDATGSFGVGVLAQGTDPTNGTGLYAQGSGDGYAVYVGGNGRLGFALPTTFGPPTSGSYSLIDIVGDHAGNLYANVASGTPGTFRKIIGPGTAGAFHAISPVRAYDSRAPQPSPGALSAGASRTVSVADGRDLVSGVTKLANAVPKGATAVTCNVTVVNTQGPSGFLAVNPGGNLVVAASTINWFGANQILANAITAALGGDRSLTIIAGPAAGTDFIIDITGYYL